MEGESEMKKAKTLPGPDRNEVKIWFQGATGSGKTLLAELFMEALKAKGLKVRNDWRGMGVRMEDQWVDLTHQNVDDVLTIELKGWTELEKLLRKREVA
jgi:hypothetical protein